MGIIMGRVGTHIFVLVLATVLVLALGCQNRRNERDREAHIQKAGSLIDQGNYDEAIRILENMDPQNDSRMYLASAYAGRGGLKSPDYWTISRRYRQILAEEEKLDPEAALILDPKSIPAAVPRWIRIAIPRFDESLRSFNQTRKRLSAIPLIPVAARSDLEKARMVLNEVPTEGGHLYRAVLGIVLLRAYFEDGNELSEKLQQDSEGTCSPIAGKILHALVIAYDYSFDILRDLRIAFPSKVAEADRFEANIKLADVREKQLRALADPKGRSICKDFPLAPLPGGKE